MGVKEFIYLFSDGSLSHYLQIVLTDFKVLSAVVGAPLLFYARKFVKMTPWKSDDKLLESAEKTLHIPKGEDDETK
jgi:hypothetical protein